MSEGKAVALWFVIVAFALWAGFHERYMEPHSQAWIENFDEMQDAKSNFYRGHL